MGCDNELGLLITRFTKRLTLLQLRCIGNYLTRRRVVFSERFDESFDELFNLNFQLIMHCPRHAKVCNFKELIFLSTFEKKIQEKRKKFIFCDAEQRNAQEELNFACKNRLSEKNRLIEYFVLQLFCSL